MRDTFGKIALAPSSGIAPILGQLGFPLKPAPFIEVPLMLKSSPLRAAAAFLMLFGAFAFAETKNSRPVIVAAFADDEPGFPRSVKEIKETLKKIAGTPKKGKDLASQREEAFRRLQMYRYLAGVPYEDMKMDDDFNRMSQAAAVACDKLKRLDRVLTKNPGMSEEEFKLAKTGLANCNLTFGASRLVESIDYFMAEPDPKNSADYRRWCIFPTMSKMGFGISGKATAMYSSDRSAENVPDFDFVSWPPAGYLPVEFFKAKNIWNASLNPDKFKALDNMAQVRIFHADAQMKKMGEPLKLDFFMIDNRLVGLPICVVFRPEKISVTPGKRYLVEIGGLIQAKDKARRTISYPVAFIK